MLHLLTAVIFLISAATVFGDDSEWMAKAEIEGRVVFYTTMGIDTVRPVTDAFERKYPFLKVEVLKGNSEGLFNRVVIEHLAGKVHGDVINLSVMPLLKNKQVLAVHESPELEMFQPKFRDPDKTWVGLVGNYFVIGYNTQLVPKKNAPKDWKDLIQPWWAGKIAIDREDYDWFGGMLEYFGPQEGKRFMEALSAQQLN